MLNKAIVFFILFLSATASFAQKDLIRFNNITIDNGLIQGSVTGIVHGSDGFIWIASADGLHRYDGYSFKIYRNDPQNKNSLPDNYINCIFEDGHGNLLLGLFSGDVCVLNKNNSTFKILNLKNRIPVMSAKPVTCINEDGKGSYLIGYEEGGLIKYDTSKHIIKTFTSSVTPNLKSNSITCITKDMYTGDFLLGTALGLCVYNTLNESITQAHYLTNLENLPITTVLTPKPDKILIGTHGRGLYQYTRGSDSASRVKLPKSKGTRFISFIKQVPTQNEIWIGTLGGIIKWQDSSKTLYTNNPLNPESLVDNNTQTATIDRFGTVWIGTLNGLSRFDRRMKLFNLFREFHWDDSLLNNNVYCIYEDPSKNIWLGTQSSGIIKFNPKTEQIIAWPVIKTPSIETRMVRAIFKDQSGQMWIGSRDGGLFKFFPEKNNFIQIIGEKGFEISSLTIRNIYEGRDGTLWIGTANGLNSYNRKTNQFEVFRAVEASPINNNIYQIVESPDRKSLYLACFRGGFQIFNLTTKKFKLFNTEAPHKTGYVKSYAMCLEVLENDSIMLGTYGNGLYIINTKTGGHRNITEKQGLSNNSVYGILRHGNTFWLSTNRGLSSFNIKTGEIKKFGLRNYIQSNEFNEGAYCKTSDGTFYFGGVNGFNYFNPDNFPQGNEFSKTEITSIKKGDIELPFLINSEGERYIELNYHDNLISFEFATLNFKPSQINQYEYMLAGFDENWIKAGGRTIAYYTKLSPGEYIFKVQSVSNNSGAPNTIAFIKIIIEPPFWQTWWFYSLILLFILGLIYIIIKWRTQIIDRNYRHKLAELELKALRSQMNPHFIFNSLNSIQYFILKKEPKAAYNYLTKFSSLMRMILQNSKHKSITLKAEHDWLKTYLELENLRMEDALHFKITIAKDLHPDNIYVPTMVLQPYVENAIIHGLLPKDTDKELSIEIKSDDQKLKCIITDNGIGRTKSQELNKLRLKNHESTAMTLTKDRLAILNIDTGNDVGPKVIDLYDEAGKSIGTRVELILPLIIQHNNMNP